MSVQEIPTQATGRPVTVMKERGTLTGLLFTFFLCTLLLLSIVLSTLSSLEQRMGNIETKLLERLDVEKGSALAPSRN
ncbi:MAG: hypothetical protein K2W95_22320 [Candidatus Obscuribacterales bacterium]|nr:hypothetical protein [Candidatus Obscuribacterales bacterium]